MYTLGQNEHQNVHPRRISTSLYCIILGQVYILMLTVCIHYLNICYVCVINHLEESMLDFGAGDGV